MPAAAVIPAPIAYIKVVAVKKLVVGFWIESNGLPKGLHCWALSSSRRPCVPLTGCAWGSGLLL